MHRFPYTCPPIHDHANKMMPITTAITGPTMNKPNNKDVPASAKTRKGPAFFSFRFSIKLSKCAIL